MTFVSSLAGKNFESKEINVEFTKTIQPGLNKVENKIHINKPELWWLWDLGKPNLYKV